MVSTARPLGLERRQTDRQKNGEMDRGTDGGTDRQTDSQGNKGFNQIYGH